MRAYSLFALVGLSALTGGCFVVDGESTEELNCGLTAAAGHF